MPALMIRGFDCTDLADAESQVISFAVTQESPTQVYPLDP